MRIGQAALPAVVVLTVGAWTPDLASSDDGALPDGPLSTPTEFAYGATGKPVDRPFTFGAIDLFTDQADGEPIVLRHLEIVADRPIALVGARVLGRHRKSGQTFITQDQWPPSPREALGPFGPSPRLEGYRITPAAWTTRPGGIGAEVIVGLRVHKPGTYHVRAIRLTYSSAGVRFRERLPVRFRFTARRSRADG